MALVLSDIGADAFLEAYFNDTWPAGGINLTLKLFVTDVTPTQDSVVGDFTEAVGGGYAAKTLTNGSWTVTPGNDPSDALYAAQDFVFTGPLTTNTDIYGYYVVDDDDVLVWAEKRASTYTPANNGDTLRITPAFELSSGTPS